MDLNSESYQRKVAFVVLLASRNMDFDQSWKEFGDLNGWNPGKNTFLFIETGRNHDSAAKPELYD